MKIERIFNINSTETLDSASKVLVELQLMALVEHIIDPSQNAQKEDAA